MEARLTAMTNGFKDDLDVAIAKADLTEFNELATTYSSLMNAASKNLSAG